jgi:hypothetical protein
MGEIHHFKVWSVNKGEWVIPSMKLGVKAIAELNGTIIPDTMEKIVDERGVERKSGKDDA